MKLGYCEIMKILFNHNVDLEVVDVSGSNFLHQALYLFILFYYFILFYFILFYFYFIFIYFLKKKSISKNGHTEAIKISVIQKKIIIF